MVAGYVGVFLFLRDYYTYIVKLKAKHFVNMQEKITKLMKLFSCVSGRENTVDFYSQNTQRVPLRIPEKF